MCLSHGDRGPSPPRLPHRPDENLYFLFLTLPILRCCLLPAKPPRWRQNRPAGEEARRRGGQGGAEEAYAHAGAEEGGGGSGDGAGDDIEEGAVAAGQARRRSEDGRAFAGVAGRGSDRVWDGEDRSGSEGGPCVFRDGVLPVARSEQPAVAVLLGEEAGVVEDGGRLGHEGSETPSPSRVIGLFDSKRRSGGVQDGKKLSSFLSLHFFASDETLVSFFLFREQEGSF